MIRQATPNPESKLREGSISNTFGSCTYIGPEMNSQRAY